MQTYVGIPWSDLGRDRETGVDCWGLIQLFYREELGIEVPGYTEDYATDWELSERASIIEREIGAWDEVFPPKRGDLALFRIGKVASHIAIVIDPHAKWMLHARKVVGVCREQWTQPMWARRLVGFYRLRKP